jgi:hypothetical protein
LHAREAKCIDSYPSYLYHWVRTKVAPIRP